MPWAKRGKGLAAALHSYLASARATWAALRRLPWGGTAIVIAPPTIAPVFAWIAGAMTGSRIAIDAHSGAFNNPKWKPMSWLIAVLSWLRVPLIVTNRDVCARLPVRASSVFVLHDPVFAREPIQVSSPAEDDRELGELGLERGGYVVFPASGEFDEPIDELSTAASRHPEIPVLVTGSHRSTPKLSPLRYTGWLSDTTYAAVLRNACAVLALTTREETMQRSAYEALYEGVPVIASDTAVLRDFLGDAAEFARSEPAALANAIARVVAEPTRYRRAMRRRQESFRRESALAVEALLAALGDGSDIDSGGRRAS